MKKINITYIIDQMKKYEVVSFDIFDTLIYRDVRSFEEVFYMMEKRTDLKNRGIRNFGVHRLSAERKCRKKSEKQEITLKEIYDRLGTVYSKENCEFLKKLEIESEIELSERNIGIYKVYQECIKLEKRIILTSDMYLPIEVIQKILEKNGITNYERLFLSSEHMLTKQNGDLYDRILKVLDIDRKSLIHIGDNIISDFFKPKLKGIDAIVIPKNNNFWHHYGAHDISNNILKTDYDNLCSFIGNRLSLKQHNDKRSYYYGIGYENFGPLLYGYCEWLSIEIKKLNFNKIFFLSRDGQIIKKAYENICESDSNHEYIYVSRRALIIPTLWMCHTLSEVADTMFFQRLGTIEEFLNRIGLEAVKYQKVTEQYGFDINTIYSYKTLFEDSSFNLFFDRIFDDVKNNSKKEYDLLVRYLKQIGFEGNVAIVDIGWNGNMQKALERVCDYAGIKVNINGFYVGINPHANNFVKHNKAKGYLFAPQYKEHLYELQKNFTSLFEIFFSADHGSVINYEISESGVAPVLLPFEYISGKNNLDDYYIIDTIQHGAQDFCIDIHYNKSMLISIDPEVMFQNFINLGVRPNYEDAERLGDLKHFDDSIIRIAAPFEFTRYVSSPGLMVTDLRQNLNIWKMGYFRRLFKVNFPYYRIFRIIQHVTNAYRK